ncbi:MAG TPA: hypothetical protein VIU40_10050 [Geobacteraceae bacterium]
MKKMIRHKGRLALVGLLFPYAISLCLIILFKEHIGDKVYKARPEEFNLYVNIIVYSVFSALIVGWLLSIPFCFYSLHFKLPTTKKINKIALCILYGLGYFIINSVNSAGLLAFYLFVWACAGGVLC